MATNDKKLLTLDHIQYIKDYIDDTNGLTNQRIDTDVMNNIQTAINTAITNIRNDYDAKYAELIDSIADVRENGNADELAELNLRLDALTADANDKVSTLESLNERIIKLSNDVLAISEGIEDGSALSNGQLNDIINTALIESTTISDDMVETPNLYTSNLVALIGKFGTIKADNIDGNGIYGKTIGSNNNILGTTDPKWVINNDGSGYLAQKNIKWNNDGSGDLANNAISWDKFGNVTFGNNVKISFNNVDGADASLSQKVYERMQSYDGELQTYVERYVENNTASKDDINSINNQLSGLTTINENIEELNQLYNACNAAIEEINNSYTTDIEPLKSALNDIDTRIQQAVDDGNLELMEEFENYKTIVTSKINTFDRLYADTYASVLNLQGEIQNIQNSNLDPESITEILNTALINTTEIDNTSISSPTMLAKKIVGLVGKFGTIKASKISGTHIQGYTVSAPLEVKDADGNPVYKTTLDADGNPVYVYETVKNADGTDMLDEEGNPVYVTEYDETLNEDVPVRKKVVKDIDDAAWALKADGSGHLANGKISWDSEGQLNVSGNIGQVNGDKIGPWTLVEESDGKKYITDEERINTFGNDGSFKIGGDNGILGNDNGIQFGDGENGFSLDTNGNLTFGSGVTLSWNNVTDNNNVATKSDIPSLDDYVTKDYLNGDVFTEIGENWIKTADITCKTLDTIPDEEIDKIKIQDNTICCIGNDGKQNLIISSNNVNTELIGEILASTQEYTSNLLYVHDMSFVYLDNSINNFEYTNSTEYTNISTPEKIGYCTKNSKLSFQPCVIPYKVAQTLVNINSNSQYVNNSNWEIVDNCYINLYKYDATNDKWNHVESITLNPTSTFGGVESSNWEELTISMAVASSPSNAYVRRYKQSVSITIEEAGVYGVTISFNANSINCASNTSNNGSTIKSMQCFSTIKVEDNITNFADNYTEIGKDGIITYDGNNLLMCTRNGVEIRSKRLPNSTNFYGLKVCPKGIFVAYGDSSSKEGSWEGWKKLDLIKLKTLFVDE